MNLNKGFIMDDKLFMRFIGQHLETMVWLNSLTLSDIFEASSILKAAKKHTLTTTGCSQAKFKDVVEFSIFKEEDVPIIECYYSFLDNIRLARRQNPKPF